MDYSALAQQYFTAFERKDLEFLAGILHPDVVLTDWDQHVQGREALLALNRGVFESLEKIVVNLRYLHVAGTTVIGEMELELQPGAIRLKVVDVITFDEQGSIRSIRAYKG
ncbi:MAG: nuclear transport factor 2 family protein [Magnetococcales bacterium]|nr:nuclear transport factor 2 family protein [Magnetococcales bacterium]MBF0150413.1 nuclear transport factor 2 family protein [Magnetococcales bacterium]MBF0173959.1 nuclear transport factor 2 family protein [Magnetococcales bacterium]MBF0346816.1 nuclear transport factor 2 family protein [Magnetococcales bacterium]MBF0632130.1 nuclear transport factor 2 family protein [Magnetococcales bacterium]